MTQLGAQDTMYNSLAGRRLGARRSRFLSSTIVATVLFSSCGAKAQDQPTPPITPAPASPPASPTPPPSGQPSGTPPANPNLPPVTVEKPATRVRRAAPAKPTPQAPPTVVSRPGPTPRVAQRPGQVPVPAQAPIAPPTQSLFGSLIPAGAISVSNVPQVAPGVPSPNLNAIATSATRLDLPVRETPASVDVITQQTMQDQRYRTNVDAAARAVGVLAINPAGAQGGF
jgi:hypothetical protein